MSSPALPHDLLDADLYAHLRALAGRIWQERASQNQTLHPTALVHEAWLKLSGHPGFTDRKHFLRTAALAMRQILVDHERARGADRRGGGRMRTTLSGLADGGEPLDLLALDEALDRLGALDPEAADLVVLRFFGGLDNAELAEVLGCSVRTVNSRWRHARAWLIAQLRGA